MLRIEHPTATRGGEMVAADKIKPEQGRGVRDQHKVPERTFYNGIAAWTGGRRCMFQVKSIHSHDFSLAWPGPIARHFRSCKQKYFNVRKWRDLEREEV